MLDVGSHFTLILTYDASLNVAFVGGWLCAMQQLDKVKSVHLQPPTTKDLSLTMPPHILFSCHVSRRFHWVGLDSTVMACLGCCACVSVLGGFH